jgi:16S rRNA (cytosine1402-N4)-methyltransferase
MAGGYHIPVLGTLVCQMMVNKKDGVYYDGTLGGGGHAELVLSMLSEQALYIGVDRDAEALEYSRKRLARFSNVVYYHGVYNDFAGALQTAGAEKLDGILLDLGLSSHQIDDGGRGFTFSADAELDMRMNREEHLTAADILDQYSLDDLTRVFRKYGEEKFSRRIAGRIVKMRMQHPLKRSSDLTAVIDSCTPYKMRVKTYARIFQALRIEVNEELRIIEDTLQESLNYLNSGAKIIVISYHSLEDRIVKDFFRREENPCICPPEIPYCVCGKKATIKRVKPFLIRPDEDEIKNNSRARSAKMRVGERV